MSGPLVVVDLVAKGTLLLAAGGITTALLRHSSAAIRHFIWTLTLGALVALVVLTPAAPSIPLRLAVLAPPPDISPSRSLRDEPVVTRMVANAAPRARGGVRERAKPMGAPTRDASGVARFRTTASLWNPALLIVALYLTGCLVVLVRCLLGHVAVARLVRRGTIASAADVDAAQRVAAALGVRRPVRLLVSDRVGAPMTSGLIRPVILLPATAATWSDERRAVVLVHELAHIARFDYLAQLIATGASALFWFHPAVWIAGARLRAEGERAADDRVLDAGIGGVRYAAHLLDLARQARPIPHSAAVAVGMVRSSQLEGRVRAMLDTSLSRARLPRRWPAVGGAVAVLLLYPLAGLHTELTAAPAHQIIVVPPPVEHPDVVDHPSVVEHVAPDTSGPAIAEQRASVEPAAVTAGTPFDSTFEKVIEVAGADRLVLDLRTGGSVIVHGWNEPRIRVQASLSGRNWRETRVSLERAENDIRLRSAFRERIEESETSHEFEIWVPRRFDIDLRSSGGGLTVRDLEGRIGGSTGGGSIDIKGATGRLSLETGGGDVRVTDSDLSGSVSTGGGRVVIARVTGGLRGSSGSGPVIYGDVTGAGGEELERALREPDLNRRGRSRTTTSSSFSEREEVVQRDRREDRREEQREEQRDERRSTTTRIDGSTVTTRRDETPGLKANERGLHYTKAGGTISFDALPNGGFLSTGGGAITVGSAGGALEVNTGGGDIRLRRITGDASATTGAGDVTITVVNTDGTAHTIEAWSGYGRIILELPADLDATVDLESAYTNNSKGRTRIESDFTLERIETANWDDSEGTPRKYVRARGTFGKGTGLIKVRTVNGDVVVRRR